MTPRTTLRTRVAAPPVREALLLLAGVGVVAVGAGPARSTPGALQPALYAAVLLTGALGALLVAAAPAARRVVALETLLVLVVAVPFTRIPSGGEVTASVAVVVAGLTVAALVRSGPPPRGWWLATALVVLLAAVTAAAPDRLGLLRLMPFAVAFLAAFLLFGAADPGERRSVLRLLLGLAVVEALLAVVEPLAGWATLWAPGKISAAGVEKALHNPLLPALDRAQGTMGHPLALGVLLVAAIALLVRDGVGLPARLRVAAAVPLALGLLASGSRNSLALAVLLVLAFVPGWRAARRAAAVVAAVLAVVVVGALVAAPVLQGWFASGSATHRAGALDALPGLLAGQPPLRVLLGNGWASSDRMFDAGLLQSDGLRAVDDEFVLLLAQGGLVAVALYVVLLVLALRRAERALLPLVLVVLVTSAVFDLLAWPSSAALAGLALASAPARVRSPRPRRAAQPERLYSR